MMICIYVIVLMRNERGWVSFLLLLLLLRRRRRRRRDESVRYLPTRGVDDAAFWPVCGLIRTLETLFA